MSPRAIPRFLSCAALVGLLAVVGCGSGALAPDPHPTTASSPTSAAQDRNLGMARGDILRRIVATRPRGCAAASRRTTYVRQASTVTPTASPRVFLVDEFPDPYAIALNRSTGAVIWKSAPFAPPLN